APPSTGSGAAGASHQQRGAGPSHPTDPASRSAGSSPSELRPVAPASLPRRRRGHGPGPLSPTLVRPDLPRCEQASNEEILMKRFVVGVDGSESSLLALRWAVQQATLEDAAVEAVHAWQVPYAASGMGGMPFDLQMLADGARATLDGIVDSIDASS